MQALRSTALVTAVIGLSGVWLCATAAASTVVLLTDHFDAPQVDLTRYEVQTTGEGHVDIWPVSCLDVASGTGATRGSGSAFVRSYASASLQDYSQIEFRGRIRAYEDNHAIYDPNGMPRGLRVGTSASDAIEFFSSAWNVIGTRTTAAGRATTTYYTLPGTVFQFYDYGILATPGSVSF